MGKQKKANKKARFSEYFQKFKKGEFVAITKKPSVKSSFPKRLQGRTGKVGEKRGKAYIISILDKDKEKKFLIHPVHLKKIK